MKLDVNALRYLDNDDFRALTGVEIGQKNHEIVPLPLISSIARLRHGGAEKLLSNLCRHKLLHHESKPYNGYRLTNLGYDYLALRTFLSRSLVSGVGRQIGVGKESDIFLVNNEDGDELCLKLHRLGRTSFRAIKTKRDYHKGRKSPSWLYLSRLAAIKEFEFMKVLRENGFPVPVPVSQNRHCLVMGLVDGFPLNQVKELEDKESLYVRCMDLIARFARHGLIHGDFNEFNLMVNEQGDLTVIDFPQMVSVAHPNARMYFERDLNCVSRFFRKRFDFVMDYRPEFEAVVQQREKFLDREVMASGFTKAMAKELDVFILTDAKEDGGETESDEEDKDADVRDGDEELVADGEDVEEVAAAGDEEAEKGREKDENEPEQEQVLAKAKEERKNVNDAPDAYLAFDYVTEKRAVVGRTSEDIRRRVRRETGRKAKGKGKSAVKQSRNNAKNRDKRELKQVIKER